MGVKARAWDLKVELHNEYCLKVAKGDNSVKDEVLQLGKERDQLKDAYERLNFSKKDEDEETYLGTLESIKSNEIPSVVKSFT